MSEKLNEVDLKTKDNEADPAKASKTSPDSHITGPDASNQQNFTAPESKQATPSNLPITASAPSAKPSVADTSSVTPKIDPELEAYQKLRQSLKSLVKKKAKIDKDLEELEEEISVREDTYLQESSAGNVAKGFDQYTKSSQNRRKSVVTDQDRIFSQSSTSFEAEL